MIAVRRKILLILLSVFIGAFAFAEGKQSSQLVKPGHWIYDDLGVLALESKANMYLENQPLTVGEIRYCLKDVDYEKLSSSGKLVYNKVQDYLNDEEDFAKDEGFRFFINTKLNPEVFYKSNKDLDWSFRINLKDDPFVIPVIFGFSDYFTLQADLSFGLKPLAAQSHNHYMNIPFNTYNYDFELPKFAYGAFTKFFDNWGISAHIGKEGMQIGNSSLGSVIYNDTFNTDFYSQFNLYSKYLRYSLDVSQVDNKKFLYLHNFTIKPFKNFSIGAIEGSLLNAPFELRYLNPLMLMHSFGSWEQYDPKEKEFYGESNFCAYLAFIIEYIPITNLRMYAIYSQNEFLDIGGSITQSALSMPDSVGFQFGTEYIIPFENQSHLKTLFELTYNSPYLYIKHSPEWSLYRDRKDMRGKDSVISWIGSPFGPDCLAFQLKAEYDTHKRWKASIDDIFSIHGENTAENLFNKDDLTKYDPSGTSGKWIYYPGVKFKHATTEEERNAAVKDSRNMWVHGIPEFKNQIRLNGSYKIFDNLEVTGQFVYTFAFNNNNILDNFDQGVELALSVTYQLF